MRFFISFLFAILFSHQALADQWFEDIKANASDEELYQLLYEMPKGGDLHLHISGSGFPEDWYELGVAAKEYGYNYYTKVRINNCREYGSQAFGVPWPYLMMFVTLQESSLKKLPECEQEEFERLEDLTIEQKLGWLNSIKLDKPFEGRMEFFETHWQRLADLAANPVIRGEILYRNLRDFSREGLIYLEPQVNAFGYMATDGSEISPDEVAKQINARLAQKDAQSLGITWRFQQAILRFIPSAEQSLEESWAFISRNEPWVALNMVGREDDDKGHPLRFLETLRKLRQQDGSVKLSIHAGEVDEPNYHLRDTLLLGADRIGHGLNLITDPETMRLMRHGPYMIEINLISNLLLEYVSDYSQHPFPEFLRIGIPVALSTDDRGMWDSNMTDEFFVAVKEFNLSWDEVKLLSRNSLQYAFVDEETKADLLETYNSRIKKFEEKLNSHGIDALKNVHSPKRGFICSRYRLCGAK
jgi:adenosine deaminase CECR1